MSTTLMLVELRAYFENYCVVLRLCVRFAKCFRHEHVQESIDSVIIKFLKVRIGRDLRWYMANVK